MSGMTTTTTHDDLNEVRLRGRLAAAPEYREMPSGDTLAIFRLTVSRPTSERGRVDSLDCVSSKAKVRRTLERAQVGDGVEVDGSLRRRFWRSPSGPASRYAVDVATLRLLRSGRRGVASPGRTPASE